ncbi:hypothetical protein [Bordetella genomosp. 13]|uniref:Uncharacterized protein n=1 Tax=Bordetella genomosp. 13 TaxID=463040 RepID=A0A1W6ZD79_9BORD|nr:hypothetical protein [Bordetella genomosp. 13]ARP95225.1 hypothetical protein CAL15_13020 [Bordetella genomosp. 13]
MTHVTTLATLVPDDPVSTSCSNTSGHSAVDQQSLTDEAVDAYSQGCRSLIDEFSSAASFTEDASPGDGLSQQRLVLFAAMVGAGLLARGAGSATWVKNLQKVILAQSRNLAANDSASDARIPP